MEVTFGGRTDNAQIPAKLVQHLQEKFHEDRFLDAGYADTEMTLYGEGYGAGIQKGGGNYSAEQKFILFDVKIGDFWLERPNVEDIAAKLGIPVVAHCGTWTLQRMIEAVRDNLFSRASAINPSADVEGYVGTPLIPLFARNGDRIITKVKYRDFQ
jgi:hypothetical protein